VAILDTSFERTLFSRDSFLFGTPSPFFFALNISFIYRFAKDWLLNKNRPLVIQEGHFQHKASVPYENTVLLSDEEADKLEEALMYQLENEALYLNPELTLRELAETIGSTEKKVSYLLNQNLKISYYELINKCRVEKFKTEIAKPENKSLSIVGVALNCGFSSKSSFYRAFKSQVSMSPAKYVRDVLKSQ
jgi:AraC-like DNA-binding protein